MHHHFLTADTTASDLDDVARGLAGDVRILVLDGAWAGPSIFPSAWMSSPDLITVAVLRGTVDRVGLALACDLRVAEASAHFRHEALPSSGHVLASGGSARVLAWSLTRQTVSAPEWYSAGLLSRLAAHDEVDDAVARLLREVLALPRPVVTESKALLQGADRRTPQEQWKAESQSRSRALQEE